MMLICAVAAGCAMRPGRNPAEEAKPGSGEASPGADATKPSESRAPAPDDPSARSDGTIEILIASDLHYLSAGMTDYNPAFLNMLAKGDGKVEEYSPQITDAFLSEVWAQRPDVLIISGDLTFNGEKENHLELAGKLLRLREDGIPVLVIPGNHDLESPAARRFADGRSYQADSVTGEEFREIYGAFGYEKAVSEDPDSLSYVYPLTDRLWILMLDANTVRTPGFINNQTCRWVESQLKAAQSRGARVISVTHQNLLIHNDMFNQGFTIENNDRILGLYRQYGVRLNLSGHMHIQHIERQDGLADIATGSLLVAPSHYGKLLIGEDGACSYEARETDVADWAAGQDSGDERLLGFPAYAREYFDQGTRRKVEELLKDSGLSGDEILRMRDFAVLVNGDYFAGTLEKKKDEYMAMPEFGLWKQQAEELFFASYLSSLFDGEQQDHCRLNMRLWE